MNRPAAGARGAVRVDANFLTEYPDADRSSTEAYATLIRVGEALLSELDRTIQRSVDVKHPTFTALAVLDGSTEPLTPSEIAERVLVPSATMTSTLDALERRGWAHRVPNPADRRSSLIEISPEGRNVADRTLPGIRAVEWSLMSVLTEAERTDLVNLLERVLQRSTELALADPIPLEGRRNRPARLT